MSQKIVIKTRKSFPFFFSLQTIDSSRKSSKERKKEKIKKRSERKNLFTRTLIT